MLYCCGPLLCGFSVPTKWLKVRTASLFSDRDVVSAALLRSLFRLSVRLFVCDALAVVCPAPRPLLAQPPLPIYQRPEYQLRYCSPLLCVFNVPIKGLKSLRVYGWCICTCLSVWVDEVSANACKTRLTIVCSLMYEKLMMKTPRRTSVGRSAHVNNIFRTILTFYVIPFLNY